MIVSFSAEIEVSDSVTLEEVEDWLKFEFGEIDRLPGITRW